MKLLTRTSLILIIASLFVFLIGGVGFYKILKNISENEAKRELLNEYHRIAIKYKEYNENIDVLRKLDYLKIDFFERSHSFSGKIISYRDTVLFDSISKRYIPHKLLITQTVFDGVPAKITLSKSMIGLNDLVEKIILIFTAMALLFIIIIFFLNKFIFSKIWDDFFKAINVIKKYDIEKHEPVNFWKSDIEEFQVLNEGLDKLIQTISRNYKNLQNFTGHVSHEIQTPLAIIKSKIEILFQDETLQESTRTLLHTIYSNVNRLSAITQSLSLLTKIENNQFTERSKINLNQKLNEIIEVYEELIDAKHIRFISDFQSETNLLANDGLITILLTNLIKNAINHNIKDGRIEFTISENELICKNTGNPPADDPALFFQPFKKGDPASKSLGLGLAIVKRISDLYGLKIQYVYENELHTITVLLKESKIFANKKA